MGHQLTARFQMAAWCLLLAALWGRTVYAGPIVSFSDAQAFSSSAPVASTETFEEFQTDTAIGVGSVTVDGITYTSFNPSAIWRVSDTFVTPSPPNALVTGNVVAPATLTFNGGGFTDAIGFFLVGVGGRFPPASYQIDVATVDHELLSETISPGEVNNIFRGFTSQDGIASVTIAPVPVEVGGTISNFHLDNVSRGVISTTVPEPSSPVWAAIGVVGLGWWWRRCRRPT